jgi:hypothetical protein
MERGILSIICGLCGALSTLVVYTVVLPPGGKVLFVLLPDMIVFALLGAVIGLI